MNELSQCSICFEQYDQAARSPRLLPCQHSFCTKCLTGLVKGPVSVDCPICRVNHRIKFEDVPKNRFIIQYLETLRSPNQRSSFPNRHLEVNQQAPYPMTGTGVYPTAPFPNMPSSYNEVPYVPIIAETHVNNPILFPNGANHPPREVPISQQYIPGSNTQNKQTWDDKRYLKNLFDDIDHNHDGEISANELHEALKKGQPINQFDYNTIAILLKKYDKNHDNEISFEEFYQLFAELNNQYNEFLDIDLDFSGTIDSRELSNALKKKGFDCTQNFYNNLFGEMMRRNLVPQQKVTFDIFVRIIARFENLRNEFRQLPQNKNKQLDHLQLEQFIAQKFFS